MTSIDYTVTLYEYNGKYYMQGLLFTQEITRVEYEMYRRQSSLAASRYEMAEKKIITNNKFNNQ